MNGTMNYGGFTEMLREKAQEVFGESFKVQIFDTLKNNGEKKIGLSIRAEGTNISPTIYCEDFYMDYLNGRELDDIVTEILKIYSAHREGPNIDIERFTDYEWVKDKIFLKLVNAEKNEELLSIAPHRPIMDLVIIYGVFLEEYEGSCASITIKNEHLEHWNVTEEDIYQMAMENTPRLFSDECWTMDGLLADMGCPTTEAAMPMYVLSNKVRINGAAVMLYADKLKQLSERYDSDIYILPSSIHEVIAIPSCYLPNSEELKIMITEVNNTQVSAEEILSYSLYKYEQGKGICMVA